MRKRILIIMTCLYLQFIGCENGVKKTANDFNEMTKKTNPVVYFEIPVQDMDRAIEFYQTVFGFSFEREIIDSNEMALFPFSEGQSGITGALAKGEIYKPTSDGVLIYFRVESIDETLSKALEKGGKELYPKTSNGDLGFVAEFEDLEGNRIALHQVAN